MLGGSGRCGSGTDVPVPSARWHEGEESMGCVMQQLFYEVGRQTPVIFIDHNVFTSLAVSDYAVFIPLFCETAGLGAFYFPSIEGCEDGTGVGWLSLACTEI